MLRSIAISVSVITLVGCASITGDTTQPVKLDAKTKDKQVVTSAECTMSNDYGTINAKSGQTVQVRRSSKDLDITCVHPNNPNAVGRAISRANAGMAGNIIFGGGIGAIIDHNKGTAYSYPSWIEVVFGETLIFDRSDEKDGQPTPGRAPQK